MACKAYEKPSQISIPSDFLTSHAKYCNNRSHRNDWVFNNFDLEKYSKSITLISRRRLSSKGHKIIRVICDENKFSLESEPKDIDILIHCAAETRSNKEDCLRKGNVEYTQFLVDLAIKWKVRCFIFLSTDLVSASHPGRYAQSKIKCEKIVRDSKIPKVLILRLPPVYAESDQNNNSTLNNLILSSKKHPVLLPMGGRFWMEIATLAQINQAIHKSCLALNDSNYEMNCETSSINLREL